jgi:pimeloyl-ACP methyl ester carboxylesterase
MPAVANEIHLWLESQSITQAVMIGWSIGGSAVLSYCEHYGDDCLNGVGIVDVSPKLGASPDWELGEGTTLGSDILDKWVQEWGKNKTGLAHEIYSMGFRCPDQFASVIGELAAEAEFAHTEAAIALLVDAFSRDYRETVRNLRVPALLLYGDESSSSNAFIRGFMVGAARQGHLEVFKKSGHCLMFENPDRFTSVLSKFTDDVAKKA